MIRGTTPTFTLTIHDPSDSLDLTQANNVYVTIRQDAFDVTKTGEDLTVEARKVSGWLTQEETIQLKAGKTALVQVNWTYTDVGGSVKRAATKVQDMQVGRQLLPEVLA